MTELYFEDFAAGQRYDCGARALAETEVTAFAAQFDPQPMHLDPAAAKASMLGGLAASGWHVCALNMRLYYDGLLSRVRGLGSPGVAETRWRRPALAGATLALTVEITETRPSRSRPAVGLVGFATDLRDQASGETVATQRFTVLIERRTPAAPQPDAAPSRNAARPAPSPPPPAETPDAAASQAALAWVCADDIELGVPVALGTETLDAEAIIAFARQFDPQPFHLDRAAAEQSLFGGLAASGWHTTALWMRRLVLSRGAGLQSLPPPQRAEAARAMGPGLGFDALEWRRPVLEGDTLSFSSTPETLEPFEPRPGWLRLRSENRAVNQKGEVAMRFRGDALIRAPR